MTGTARRAATATLVAVAIVVAALALWKIRLVIALLFLGFVIASAMRPSVEWLHRRARVPRSVGVVLHYLALPRRDRALPLPRRTRRHHPGRPRDRQVPTSTLPAPPRGRPLARDPARDPQRDRQAAAAAAVGRAASLHPADHRRRRRRSRSLVGILFMFAVGAYWIFERDSDDRARPVARAAQAPARDPRHVGPDRHEARRVRARAVPARGDRRVRCSRLAFWLDGEPYWLLIGVLRRARRARADRRAARRRSGRDRCRADRRLDGGGRRGHRGARPAAARRTTSSRRASWATRSDCRRSSCSSR